MSFYWQPPRGVTGIFFWGGKVIFPDFFPGVKCFFPVENSHFGRPKTNFRRFQKWKAKKKKKKKVLTSFSDVFLLPFPIFHLFFSIFTPFPFFPCLFFPDTSANISRSEVSGGALCPPCPPPPPACYATATTIWIWFVRFQVGSYVNAICSRCVCLLVYFFSTHIWHPAGLVNVQVLIVTSLPTWNQVDCSIAYTNGLY